MARRTYRVIQWATGNVGKVALRHFIENPDLELMGVYVTNPEKVGKDAGEIAGTAPTGVLATNDADRIVAMNADCVHFSPMLPDVDMVCRLLRSGKNVVCPIGPFYPTDRYKADVDKIAAACKDGGVSFHGSGIHPGFAGDILPLTVTRLMNRIGHIHLYEIVDYVVNPSIYIAFMGFGREPADLLANPSRSGEAPYIFAQSMTLIADALGRTIENLTTKLEVAVATKDIAYANGIVGAGTVAGQHYEWTAWTGGKPFITYHCFWTMGDKDIEPKWNAGDSGYRVVIEGDPPLELTLSGPKHPDGRRTYPGLPWTALAGVTAIPAVCDASPGIVTHLDLGVVRPTGLLR